MLGNGDKLKVVNSQQSTVNNQQSTVNSQQSTVNIIGVVKSSLQEVTYLHFSYE
ncbi:MAG: hypothetical protein F6K31_38355 [Symploca sp. SIO2G7]|nr:hypothetical protein [Symploca sp. SIO2G7]